MAPGSFRFEGLVLDCSDRQLRRGDVPVELNSRYLDALALLVREQGKLVSKDRFLEEVWRGIPVTDEALTQCIRTLRRQLGDDAAHPRFIETVPKHGYRFIAPVETIASPRIEDSGAVPMTSADRHYPFLLIGAAGTVGGGVAGLLGGLFYGFVGASGPLQPGVGAISVLLVLLCLTFILAVIGAAGVSFGIAAAGFARSSRWLWTILGGAFGGLVVGAIVKLLGTDAFNLLFGQSPGDITGAGEGGLLGAAVGLGAWIGTRGGALRLRRGIAAGALTGAIAGVAIPAMGGRIMGGSLDLLARQFPHSRLRLDAIGQLFGERGLGAVGELVTGALEGMLFGACIVGAIILALRRSRKI